MNEKDPEDEFDPPGETNPRTPAEEDLLRQAYVEHGKRIGALEQRVEEMQHSMQNEINKLKEKIKKMKEQYENEVLKP